MNDFLLKIWGEGKDLDMLQMGTRTFVMFFITLVLIRIAGMRSLGQKSPFDAIITIMLGAVLSRAVVGVSPFLPTVASGVVLAVTHKLIAYISVKNDWVGFLVKGEKTLLYSNGEIITKNMNRACVSYKDLLRGLRVNMNEDKLDNIDKIYMERSGEISFLKKEKVDN